RSASARRVALSATRAPSLTPFRISIAVTVLVAAPTLVGAQLVRVGLEFQVNTYMSSDQGAPDVATDGAGNFVVVWQSDQDGSYTGVFGQRYDSTGTAVGTEFQVNTYTTSQQGYPKVAA